MARPIDPSVKAAAMADLATGSGVREVSRKYGVSTGAASSLMAEARGTVQASSVRTEKRRDIGERVLGYLEESLETLTAQVRLARDPNWVHRQTANDLAIFHGVLADKTTRILAALAPVDSEPDGDDDPHIIDA